MWTARIVAIPCIGDAWVIVGFLVERYFDGFGSLADNFRNVSVLQKSRNLFGKLTTTKHVGQYHGEFLYNLLSN